MTTITPQQASIRESLPDHASDRDTRGLPIEKVGIRDLDYPIVVLDKRNERQSTVAKISASVGLPAEQRGTHMSRFVEIINAVRGEITVRNIPRILRDLQARLEADSVQLDIEFPYFISKQAPVSRAESLMKYDCGFHASADGDKTDFVLSVTVPVTTLCPCSKAISRYGAHNQRGSVVVRLRPRGFVWIEDVVAAIESCASAPLYALLKREDEKAVTEQAYENPRFVEDLVREVGVQVRDQIDTSWAHISVDNAESIHDHAAFAELEWSREECHVPRDGASTARRIPYAATCVPTSISFGTWLQRMREKRSFSQTDFARLVGVSPSYLSRIERGEKHASAELASSIASKMGEDSRAVLVRAGYLDQSTASAIAERFPDFLVWIAQETTQRA